MTVFNFFAEALYEDLQKGSFGKPAWFDYVSEEYWACRESVCLMDMSSFSKFELEVITKCLRYSCLFIDFILRSMPEGFYPISTDEAEY